MVREPREADLASTELAVRSGLDHPLRIDGNSGMESLVHTALKIQDRGATDLLAAIGTEFPVVSRFLFAAPHCRRLFCDRESGALVDSLYRPHFTV